MNIGEKMFAYINVANDLTLDMVQQYKNAMIILGDEKQIFNPLTNSYVGIGQSAYEELQRSIQQNGSDLNGLDRHLHQNTVNSIYATFSPEELATKVPDSSTNINVLGHTITNGNYPYELKANKDIVLKGIHDYNASTGQGATVDELGNPITTTTYGTSGITVNITHNGQYKTGTDESGFAFAYWEGQDVITLDDSVTWAYITNRNSYLMNFAKDMAVKQANRVYHDLFGADTVYIEKSFDEAFLYDRYNQTLTEIQQVYIKTQDPNEVYKNVEVLEVDGKHYVIQSGTTKILFSPDTSTAPSGYSFYSQAELESLLSPNGGIEGTTGNKVPVWYHVDAEATASNNKTIADGIQTIKEISYILDVLTDGNEDDSINLAYNISYNYVEIQKLKEWQSELGNNTVNTFQSESKNPLVTISYYSSNLWGDKDKAASGNVKLDVDLILAQTYKDANNTSYAAYINANHSVSSNTIYRYSTPNGDDKTNVANYVTITAANKDEIYEILKAKGFDGSTISLYTYESATEKYVVSSSITLGPSTLTAGNVVYCPWTRQLADVETGLTDVKWVTTYVGWTVENLKTLIDQVSGGAANNIEQAIQALDKPDTEVAGQYVSAVSEEDGIITVTRKQIPLDTLLSNEAVYSNDIFLHISPEEVLALFTADSSRTDVYELVSGTYTQLATTNGLDTTATGVNKYYLKKNLYDFTVVPQNTPATDLISNGANSSYFYKTTANGKDSYTPFDVQLELTSGSLFDNTGNVVNANEVYWLNTSTTIKQKKYIETRYVRATDGHTDMNVIAYVTSLQSASALNTGLADAWNVRQTIEAMFSWVDLKTNKIIG